MRLIGVISAVVMMCLVALAWRWSSQWVERPAVTIEAAHDVPENGLPVYAQFVVTQTLLLPAVSSITALHVPIYWPDESESLHIDLRRNGRLVQRWRQNPSQMNQVVEEYLPLAAPALLDGALEVSFSGRHITHENKERAPRVFIETADANYPHGTYRIAENEKKGDVEMRVYERVQQRHLIKEQFHARPLVVLFRGSQWVLAAIFLINVPFLFSTRSIKALPKVDAYVK